LPTAAGLRPGRAQLQPEPAQHGQEPQRGHAGSGDDERGGNDRREHQEHPGRLGHHQDRQAAREQQEDAGPQPGRPLEEAKQARMAGGRLPQRDHFSRQPGNQRVRAAGGPGEQDAHAQVRERKLQQEQPQFIGGEQRGDLETGVRSRPDRELVQAA